MRLRRARRFGDSVCAVPGIILAGFRARERTGRKIVCQIVSKRCISFQSVAGKKTDLAGISGYPAGTPLSKEEWLKPGS